MSFKMSNIIEELLLLSGVRNTDVDSSPIDMTSVLQETKKRISIMAKQNSAQIKEPGS